MAEPGKGSAPTPPPPPQETVLQAPAAVEGPSLGTGTPISALPDIGTVPGGAAALDSAQQPKAEPVHQPPPPPQETVDMPAVGKPEQTTTEADGQPPVATMPQKSPALPPPAETPVQENVAPAAPTPPPPPPPPPPQKQEGGDPELASSVHKEEKDASKAREDKPARRRWRRLRSVVCLLFLRPKSGETTPATTPPGDKHPASGLEQEKKPTAGEMPPPQKDSGSAVRAPSKPKEGKGEGETKPAAPMDGNRPEPGKEQVASLPPTSSQETTAVAAGVGAEKQIAAPAPQQPPRKQEGDAAAAPAPAPAPAAAMPQEGEEKAARRRWRWLQAAVGLLFLRPKGGETTKPPTPGETPPLSVVDSAVKPATVKGEDELTPSAKDGKKPASGQELPKPPAEKKPSRKFSAGAARKVKDEQGEESKRRRDETETQAGKATPPQPEGDERPMRKKLQKAIRLVQVLMSLFNKHRSQPAPPEKEPEETASGPGGELDIKAKTTEEKQPASGLDEEDEKKTQHHRRQEGEGKQARRRWRWLQAAVRLLFLRPKGGGETKPPPTPGETPPLPVVDSAGKPATEKGKDEMKPSSAQEEPKPAVEKKHQNWPREEVRLEGILEEAFARLVAAEYIKELRGVRQKCLLTFSVFDLASEVKKQAMIYWWVAEFHLRHRSDPPPAAAGGGKSGSPAAPQGKAGADADISRDDNAEGIFLMLSDHGFLVPMKNWCSKVIHGCQVNPLVHWMLKRDARGGRFAELDDKGSPADLQLHSKILCLTSGNRPVLQKMRMIDESPPPQPQAARNKKDEPRRLQSQKSKKVTKEPSLLGSKSNNGQDQQQQTATKDEAQAGSKSMAAPDKAPSKKDEDPTKDKDQLAKDQQQQTAKDEAQVASKSMATVDKAPSQKTEDPTQTKEQLTEGPQNIKLISEHEHVDEILPQLFEGKRVILNVNAHVYPISRSAFLHLAECLVVLQLGRWNNLDDKTYMEVAGLDSRNAIGLLKNLRYLGLRGLSRLTELPKGIENLKKLLILDMRGCQNLVKVEASDNIVTQQLHQMQKRSVITQLKQLTHLDLTECYMLEHIGRGITCLTELQVFKGFVFATGTQGNKACRIQDLEKLKRLQKLTVSITTDAIVAKGEMAHLKNITSLRKLTITWSEIPSILEGEKVKKKREELVGRWTSFQLPEDLMKLDIRCYPKEQLKLEWHGKLEKLYLRGGDMERFSTENKSNSIKTLRLRYLKKFTMEWKDIRSELQNIEYVEIVVPNKDITREKGKSEVTVDTEDEEKLIKKVMKIPEFTLDRHGVWTKDQKEEDNKKLLAPNKDAMGNYKASRPSEQTEDSSTPNASAITGGNNDGDKAPTNEQQPKKNE